MNPVSPGFNSTLGYSGFIMDEREFSASQMNRMETTQKQVRDITLITAEGDKVTLSSDSWYQETTLTYNSLIHGKGAYARSWGDYSRFEGAQHLSISVEGDLSKEELHDIKKLLNDVDKVMSDFLSGDVNKAMAAALKIGEQDSISGFEASLQFERSVSVEQRMSAQVSSSSPATDSAFVPPGTDTLPDLIDKASDQLAGIIRDSGIDSGKALNAIEEYFSNVFNRIAEDDSPDSPKRRASGLLRSALLNKMRPPHEKLDPMEAMGS